MTIVGPLYFWAWLNSLLIDQTFQGKTIHAHYSSFDVSGVDYRIHVSGYSGNAGDSLRIDNGMAFSTIDSDKDLWVGDCSKTRGGGGWWYNGCSLANLNGRNFGKPTESYEGILWYFYANDKRSFKSSKMMLRKKWWKTFYLYTQCTVQPERQWINADTQNVKNIFFI